MQQEQSEQAQAFAQHFVSNMVVGMVVEVSQSASIFPVGASVYCYGPACELVIKAEDEVEPLLPPMTPLDALCLDPALFGAQTVIDPTTDDVGIIARDLLHGRGADIAIEASGHYGALHGEMRAVRNCARIVTLGYYKGVDRFLELGANKRKHRGADPYRQRFF